MISTKWHRVSRIVLFLLGAVPFMFLWSTGTRLHNLQKDDVISPAVELHLSVWASLPRAIHLPPVPDLSGCLQRRLQRPLRLLFAGHSRVWQLFWAMTSRSGAELRDRSASAHGAPYGGDPAPGQADWPLGTDATCVEVFRKPASWWHQRPSCSWAADSPGLQLDMRWRDMVDVHLQRLLEQSIHAPPDLLVLAVGLKDSVRSQEFRLYPQRVTDRLYAHVTSPLRQLAALPHTSVLLLLDYPSNMARARTEHDRRTAAILLLQNAIMYEIFTQVPDIHIWSSPFPDVIQFYADTCRRPVAPEVPDTAHRCLNDTLHPGSAVVEGMLDQVVSLVCH